MSDLPLIQPTDSLRETMRAIDGTGRGIALVVDSAGRLIDTVTDGDLRRAVLAAADMDSPVSGLLAAKPRADRPHPITAPADAAPSVLLAMCREWSVRQIPLVDSDGRVVGLVTLDDLLPDADSGVEAVIMAGGYGTRLLPLTESCPKPMLPVGGRPLLDRTVERLKEAGIRRVNIVTHYRGQDIADHFGDGSGHGVEVRYVSESCPMGTAGSLAAVGGDGPLLILNGDVLTGLDYRAMLAHHQERRAELTVAVRRLDWPVPFGVVDVDDGWVVRLIEKPNASLLINAGVYLMEPAVARVLPLRPLQMTEVVEWLVESGEPVAAFPITESEGWTDIGNIEDYRRAQEGT